MSDVYEDEEERGFVETALSAADAGNAGHWPTVAGYLADEVRRLRVAVLEASKPTVVDREALGLLLHDQNCDCEILKPLGDYRPEQFLEQRRRHSEYYAKQADAVLAALYPKATEGKS